MFNGPGMIPPQSHSGTNVTTRSLLSPLNANSCDYGGLFFAFQTGGTRDSKANGMNAENMWAGT